MRDYIELRLDIATDAMALRAALKTQMRKLKSANKRGAQTALYLRCKDLLERVENSISYEVNGGRERDCKAGVGEYFQIGGPNDIAYGT